MDDMDFKLKVIEDLTYIKGKIDNITYRVKTNRKMIYSIFATLSTVTIAIILKLVR